MAWGKDDIDMLAPLRDDPLQRREELKAEDAVDAEEKRLHWLKLELAFKEAFDRRKQAPQPSDLADRWSGTGHQILERTKESLLIAAADHSYKLRDYGDRFELDPASKDRVGAVFAALDEAKARGSRAVRFGDIENFSEQERDAIYRAATKRGIESQALGESPEVRQKYSVNRETWVLHENIGSARAAAEVEQGGQYHVAVDGAGVDLLGNSPEAASAMLDDLKAKTGRNLFKVDFDAGAPQSLKDAVWRAANERGLYLTGFDPSPAARTAWLADYPNLERRRFIDALKEEGGPASAWRAAKGHSDPDLAKIRARELNGKTLIPAFDPSDKAGAGLRVVGSDGSVTAEGRGLIAFGNRGDKGRDPDWVVLHNDWKSALAAAEKDPNALHLALDLRYDAKQIHGFTKRFPTADFRVAENEAGVKLSVAAAHLDRLGRAFGKPNLRQEVPAAAQKLVGNPMPATDRHRMGR